MSLTFSWALFSEVGPRAENEDAIGVWELGDDCLAVAVADGLGGHRGGRRASSLALEIFGTIISQNADADLREIALTAHEAIKLEQGQDPELRSMATTMSAAVIRGATLRLVHCGDSRIALARGDGIIRLTKDHSEAQRFFREGLLSRAELDAYPRRNVLESALGIHREPQIDVKSYELQLGDRLFFTSDGTHTKVLVRELRDLSLLSPSPSTLTSKVRALVEERKPDDNFSLAAIYVT